MTKAVASQGLRAQNKKTPAADCKRIVLEVLIAFSAFQMSPARSKLGAEKLPPVLVPKEGLGSSVLATGWKEGKKRILRHHKATMQDFV